MVVLTNTLLLRSRGSKMVVPSNRYALTLYILISVVQSQTISKPGADVCSDDQWKKNVQQQLDAIQSILQQHAIKISNFERLDATSSRDEQSLDTTTNPNEQETSKFCIKIV